MNEFLFSLLIIRFYGQNEEIFYFSKNIQIRVEIPNTFIDFFEKFPILALFKTKELTISDLPPLIASKKLDSNIQLVANYLKALKENKINEKDLIFPNITPQDFEKNFYLDQKMEILTSVKAEILSDSECQKLIFDKIKEFLKEPTYYQIVSFINMLSAQLKKFNQNYFLNAYQLIKNRGSNQSFLRTFIVNNFIEISKNVAKGAFTDLIKFKKNHNIKSFLRINNEGESEYCFK